MPNAYTYSRYRQEKQSSVHQERDSFSRWSLPRIDRVFINALEGIALLSSEDNDRIATILAIQLVYTRSLQQTVHFPQAQVHGESQLKNFIARGFAGSFEYLVAERAVHARIPHYF